MILESEFSLLEASRTLSPCAPYRLIGIPQSGVHFYMLSSAVSFPTNVNVHREPVSKKHPPSTSPHTPRRRAVPLTCLPTSCSALAPHKLGGRNSEAGWRPLCNQQNGMLTMVTWAFRAITFFSASHIISTKIKTLEHPAAWTQGDVLQLSGPSISPSASYKTVVLSPAFPWHFRVEKSL